MKLTLLRFFSVLILFLAVARAHAHDFSVVRDTIPFERTDYNNILIKAVLNEVDTVTLMFHTAASDVTLIEESVRKLKSITFTETVTGVRSWGGSSNDSRMSLHNTLQLGRLSWSDMSIWEDTNTGQGADGKFGLGLLRGKVVEIDFDHNRLIVSEALPSGLETFQKLPLVVERGNLFVELTGQLVDRVWANKFLIHSGYAGALMFDDEFVVQHGLDSILPTVGEKQLRDAFGNTVFSKKVQLPNLRIGELVLKDVSAGYFKGAAGLQRISILGGDILKRYNVVIDAERAFIYFKPNQLLYSEFSQS